MRNILRLLLTALLLDACIARATGELFFEVVPIAKGTQLVRLSLPMPNGFLAESEGLKLEPPSSGIGGLRPPAIVPAIRPLSWHPAAQALKRSVRRAMVTFPYYFKDMRPVRFRARSVTDSVVQPPAIPIALDYKHGQLTLRWRNGDQASLRPIVPLPDGTAFSKEEVIEENEFFIWRRWHFEDKSWPLIIELRCDALGTAVVVAHLQRFNPGDGFAPAFGWHVRLDSGNVEVVRRDRKLKLLTESFEHDFGSGQQVSLLTGLRNLTIYHPGASYKRCGALLLKRNADRIWDYSYYRCRAGDQLPMQYRAWRRAEVVFSPQGVACLTPTLESPHGFRVSADIWNELYSPIAQSRWLSKKHLDSASALGGKVDSREVRDAIGSVLGYHNDAILRCMAQGADWGNSTEYNDDRDEGAAFGMNRLQHCPQLFLEGWRLNDPRLVRAAVLWCENHHDQSIWWGEIGNGGSRYNNVTSLGREPLTTNYMWRSDGASSFCTKGFDAFWLAWEQTGDPRMRTALTAQFDYARKHLRSDDGECRNVGVVRDFLRLYRYSGKDVCRLEADRLFRELYTKVSSEGLFDQNGRKLTDNPPYIDQSCKVEVGYPKPYIIGHALAGLPDLLVLDTGDERIRQVVEGVAAFLVETVDPVGGWRYPHADSSSVQLDQSMETAWQLVQAAYVLGPEDRFLETIEKVLRQRILLHQRSAKVAAQLDGWEISTGLVSELSQLCQLYERPRDRDAAKDYTHGRLRLGYATPDGLVYFSEVLRYYLTYRPGSRLFELPPPNTPLANVLYRVPPARSR